MHPPLHYSNRNLARLTNDKLSGVTNRRRPRKRRNVGIRNADGVGEIVRKRSQPRAQNEPDLRAQFRLRKHKSRRGFSARKQIWSHTRSSRSGGDARCPLRVKKDGFRGRVLFTFRL
jgi:hypothetical protein